MASGFDIWGVIASVIGLLSLFQFIAAVVKSRLPRERLRTFNIMLEETENLLRSVEEEGLFDDDGGRYLASAKMKIANVCKRARSLRGDAFAAQTLKQEIRQWWSGLSGEITTTSNERRKDLAQRPKSPTRGDVILPVSPSTVGLTPDLSSATNVITSEDSSDAQDHPLEEPKENLSISSDEEQSSITLPPTETHGTFRPRLYSTDTLLRRQSSLPPYASSPPLSTTVFTRYTITSADAARATRKLVKTYRRNLMVHNVPWRSQRAQYPRHGSSAAASAIAVDRPSDATRHWKLLEAMSKARLRPYVTVVSHEVTLVAPPHAGDTVGA